MLYPFLLTETPLISAVYRLIFCNTPPIFLILLLLSMNILTIIQTSSVSFLLLSLLVPLILSQNSYCSYPVSFSLTQYLYYSLSMLFLCKIQRKQIRSYKFTYKTSLPFSLSTVTNTSQKSIKNGIWTHFSCAADSIESKISTFILKFLSFHLCKHSDILYLGISPHR